MFLHKYEKTLLPYHPLCILGSLFEPNTDSVDCNPYGRIYNTANDDKQSNVHAAGIMGGTCCA
jgi:hypothetical protein